MKSIREMTQAEIGAYVHSHLRREEIRRWSKGKGQLTKFEEFLAALETSR